jgi:hypothetical protein
MELQRNDETTQQNEFKLLIIADFQLLGFELQSVQSHLLGIKLSFPVNRC